MRWEAGEQRVNSQSSADLHREVSQRVCNATGKPLVVELGFLKVQRSREWIKGWSREGWSNGGASPDVLPMQTWPALRAGVSPPGRMATPGPLDVYKGKESTMLSTTD
jgi:hypothetical protein